MDLNKVHQRSDDYEDTIDKELGLEKMLDDLIKSDGKIDLKCDTRDLPAFPNFFEFCLDPQGLGVKPWTRQMLTGLYLFSEICNYCSNPDYLDGLESFPVNFRVQNIPEHLQLLNHGKCPVCKRTRLDMLKKRKTNYYQELVGIAGQRSGKSELTAMLMAYQTHRIVSLQKPCEVYQVLPSTTLTMTFVAINYKSSEDLLWTPYCNVIKASPWFSSFMKILDDVGHRHGEEMYRFMGTYLHIRPRNLMVYPSGPSKRTLRGRTRIAACISGNTLINTNAGLVRMHSEDKVLQYNTYNGSKTRKIENWSCTGQREDVITVRLVNGSELVCTKDHRIYTYDTDNYFTWVKAENLIKQGNKVVVTRGGDFPEVYVSTPKIIKGERSITVVEMCKWVAQQNTFTRAEINKVFPSEGFYQGKGTVHYFVKKLYAKGIVQHRRKLGYTGDIVYTVLTNDLDTILSTMFESKGRGSNSISKKSPVHINNVITPAYLNESVAIAIGVIAGVGTYNNTNLDLTINTLSKSVAYYFQACCAMAFNYKPVIETHQYKEERVYYLEVANEDVKNYLSTYCLSDSMNNSMNSIPELILLSPQEIAFSYLDGLLMVSGGIYENKYIGFTVRNSDLASEIQVLLLKMGYLSFRDESGDSITLFLDEIDSIDYIKSEYKSRQEGFYVPIKQGVRIPEQVVAAIESTAESSVDSNYLYVEVDSITDAESMLVYDITVDSPDHSFTANGFVVHNSLDELAWMDQEDDKLRGAEETYIALDRSLKTIRAAARQAVREGHYDTPPGLMVSISSPASAYDKIMRLYKQHKDSKKVFCFKKATWEMNPTLKKRDFDTDYATDPIKADRDYGANPPLAATPFMETVDTSIFKQDTENLLKYEYAIYSNRGNAYRYASHIPNKIKSIPPTILAIDAGYTSNSFGMILGGLVDNKIRVYGAAEVAPTILSPVHFPSVFNKFLRPVIEEYNVKWVMADRWNSIKLLQDIEQDTTAKQDIYSLKMIDFINFKSWVENDSIILPKLEMDVESILTFPADEYPDYFKYKPISHLYLQMRTVNEGVKTVTKGDITTDDLFRAFALMVRFLSDKEWVEENLAGEAKQFRPLALGTGVRMGVPPGNNYRSSLNLYRENDSNKALGMFRKRF